MKNSKAVKLLSAPYIVWAAAFIIIPLIMVFYYGLSDQSSQGISLFGGRIGNLNLFIPLPNSDEINIIIITI